MIETCKPATAIAVILNTTYHTYRGRIWYQGSTLLVFVSRIRWERLPVESLNIQNMLSTLTLTKTWHYHRSDGICVEIIPWDMNHTHCFLFCSRCMCAGVFQHVLACNYDWYHKTPLIHSFMSAMMRITGCTKYTCECAGNTVTNWSTNFPSNASISCWHSLMPVNNSSVYTRK